MADVLSDDVELHPTGNRLVAKLEDTKASGLVVPLGTRSLPRLVVARRGPQVSDVIEVGTEVLVRDGASTEVVIGTVKWVVFSEPDVLAVVRPRGD